jgi:DNA mismatch repair protein MutS
MEDEARKDAGSDGSAGVKAEAATPLMRQYRRIKAELPPDVILFFRLGDFYEMFFEDARRAAPILDIALTRRQGIPMCGVPYHAADAYLARLIRAGIKVALCDQMEDPAVARGLVRRDVTRIVTPGTVTEDAILEAGKPSYLAGLARAGGAFGVVLLDLSTGRFWGERRASLAEAAAVLGRAAPAECIAPPELAADAGGEALRAALRGAAPSVREEWTFAPDTARDTLLRHFGVRSLEGFGCERETAVVCAAGAVLHYVLHDLRRTVTHVRSLRLLNASDFLVLDPVTCRNLDLVPAAGQDPSATLLGCLDATRTAMGARLLRDWVLRPLAQAEPIRRRLDAVANLVGDRALRGELREALGGVRDMERLLARLAGGGGGARDLAALGHSLATLPAVRAAAAAASAAALTELAGSIVLLPELAGLLARGLMDDPPAAPRDGGFIRDGFDPQLDELRRAAGSGRAWLAEYQAREQQRTGIRGLKVRHNKVFGYYIEVSKGQLGLVPEEYVRKQTLVGAERYITPELKEHERLVFGAHERAVALEIEILERLRQAALEHTAEIQAAAAAVAQLDALASLADRAAAYGYVRPEVDDGDAVTIREGRHPVIEQRLEGERFVPNDTRLDGDRQRLLIITGPNMAGKSTYIRQVALIVIQAQMGGFVPAAGARIGVVDRVFSRVGASDDLARGRSTFMVEMEETANILHNATPRSLVILDEIGRGTSTFDGISIAWAVAEYLHNRPEVRAKTLFATHYHELTDLALTLPGVRNYNVLAREQGDRVVFLRKIVPGAADKSYGIQVARLAGLPAEVLDRAREILTNLEEGELAETGQPKIARRRARRSEAHPDQMTLFGDA